MKGFFAVILVIACLAWPTFSNEENIQIIFDHLNMLEDSLKNLANETVNLQALLGKDRVQDIPFVNHVYRILNENSETSELKKKLEDAGEKSGACEKLLETELQELSKKYHEELLSNGKLEALASFESYISVFQRRTAEMKSTFEENMELFKNGCKTNDPACQTIQSYSGEIQESSETINGLHQDIRNITSKVLEHPTAIEASVRIRQGVSSKIFDCINRNA